MTFVIGMLANCICILTVLIAGFALFIYNWLEKEKCGTILGLALIVVSLVAVVENPYDNPQYILAESIARNQTQTIFTANKNTYLVDGYYPDGTYLLNMDGKEILVVWKAVDGKTDCNRTNETKSVKD